MCPFFGRDIDAGCKPLGLGPQRGRALGDPALDNGDLLPRNLLFARRHLRVPEPLQQVTLLGLARHECWSTFPAVLGESLQSQVQLPFRRIVAAVAIQTVLLEDRPHIPLEGQPLLRHRRRADAPPGQGHQDAQVRGFSHADHLRIESGISGAGGTLRVVAVWSTRSF